MEYLIQNVHIVDPMNHRDEIDNLLIKDGIIADPETAVRPQIIDGTGLIAMPGLVDMHVHLRDPGFTDKEDILTGCKAAAAGGVTSLLAMPNTNPTVDTPEVVQYVLDKAKNADAHVYTAAAITKGLKSQEPTDIDALYAAGVKALSDDGRPVENTLFMARAMKKAAQLGLAVTAHCEDLYLANGGKINEGEVSAVLNVAGIPRAAEDTGTAREIALAAAYDVPVHICHVSTATSVALVRDAKRRGVRVTAETAPHYFTMTEQELLKRDADYRMNPPLRTEVDRLAIIEALRDGTMDAIATDHAPHTPTEKSDFIKAPNGSIGMETSLAVSYTALVCTSILTLNELIEKMSCNPAKILNISAGTLSIGAVADVVLFNPNICWTVNPEKLHGKSKNTPFKGKELNGKVVKTFCGGKLVFEE